MEIRLPFPKPHDRYFISNMGRVRYQDNPPRKLEIGGDRPVATIRLKNSKKSVKFQINRLVYCVFNNKKLSYNSMIYHKDGDKFNNKLSNLSETNDQGIINKIGIDTGHMKIPVNNKINSEIAEEIRNEYKKNKRGIYDRTISCKTLAKKYGVSTTCIGDILSGLSRNKINKRKEIFKLKNNGS